MKAKKQKTTNHGFILFIFIALVITSMGLFLFNSEPSITGQTTIESIGNSSGAIYILAILVAATIAIALTVARSKNN